MTNIAQIELLLNQLYNCAVAFYDATVRDDEQEADLLINKKIELLNLIEENKKFAGESLSELFRVMLRKLNEQENKNIQLLKAKKSVLYNQYRESTKQNQLSVKYMVNTEKKGSIVDISE